MPRAILRSISETVRFLALASIIFAFAATPALSQSNAFDTGTPAESRGGLISPSGYTQDKIETVNLATGGLAVHIPLVTIGGRGSASYTIALSYNSKLWTGQSYRDLNDEFHSGVSFDDATNRTPNRIAMDCGWFISKGPVLKTKLVSIDPIFGQPGLYFYVLTKVWLVLADGSEVELRDNATDGQPGATPLPMHPPTDRNRGRAWHSTDGSAISYVSDADNGVVNNQLAGYVYFSDGTRMRINSTGKCTKIIDRNANQLIIDYSGSIVTYTDSLGRQVTLEGGSGGATVTIIGYNGLPNRAINIATDQIVGASNNLRSDFQSLPLPIISGDYANGVEHFVFGTNPHTDVFFHSDMAATTVGTVSGYIQIDTKTPVTRVDLLDGRSFRFRYNQFGELAEIVYPGGGVSQMDYVPLGTTLCEGAGEVGSQLNRAVSVRRSLNNGTTTDATWEYVRGTGSVGGTMYPTTRVKVHQGGIAGALLMDEKHFLMALNAQYLACTTQRSNGTAYDKFENNREFRVERQTGNGTEIMSQVWAQRAAVVWQQPGYQTQQPQNDPRIIQQDTTLESGKLKRVDYEYDAFNNTTRIKEYNLGNGSPGSLRRQTERTYLTSQNSNCYTNLNGIDSTCGSFVPPNPERVIHKRRLLLTETIMDGSLNVEAYAEYEYDNYVNDGGNHAPLVSNPGMIQYDGTWFTPFFAQSQPRGNVTSARRLISGQIVGGVYATAFTQYNEAGSVVKTIDPLGHTMTASYADNFGNGTDPGTPQFVPPSGPTYALPTLVTNALMQSARTQYDYTRGLPSGVKDSNNVISKSDFDQYDRPITITAGFGLSGAQNVITQMSYPSTAANESRTSKQLDDTRWLTSRAQLDGFGRPLLTSQSEDGRHFTDPLVSYTIHSKAIYDGLGRAVKSSNPYRSTGASNTDGWTRSAFDLAGRVIDVATFSGDSNTPPPDYPQTNSNWTGSVVSTYNGEVATVRDQANKQRRSTVDGLGRLITVDEMNEFPSSTVYATTGYSYDARGNLLTVTQAQGATTQTRRFAYDAMSRLIFAANPEQNTRTDPPFSYGGQQWAVRYVYDAASNLIDKTDTRPAATGFVDVHYDYDPINRVAQRSYNDGTPQVNYSYDTATNGVGRLSSVTAAGVSTYNYTIYDALGRPTAYNQVTEGQTYLMSCTYNKAGMMVDETYPSNKVMHSEYDDAGRPAGVKKTTNSFYYAGAVATDAANRVQYSAHGAMSVMKLGNGFWEHTNFNSRLQPTQIGLGSGQTNSSVLGLDYAYGVLVGGSLDATKNNGNIQSQTITVPGTSFVQSYGYDQVNRLTSVQEKYNAKLIWTQNNGFDRWGNRTSLVNSGSKAAFLPTQSTPAVDSATNRLAGASYDAAGNYLSFGGAVTYDAENRLTLLREPGALRFKYDGDGRRVEKINDDAGPEIIVFVYNAAGRMVAEYSSTAGSFPNVKVSYLTADHLSSTRVVTDGTGTVVARHDYLPYGEEMPALVARTGIAGYGAADGIRQKFTQKERDNESGLDYFLARYYSSAQGRFTSPDQPFVGQDEEDPQTWNLYVYTSNNPLNRVDPYGDRWFYREDDKGKILEAQWVNPNNDGTYTSPGEGWNEFIPTESKPSLWLYTNNGNLVTLLGENADGSPRSKTLSTGRVEDASMDIVGLFIPGKLGVKGLVAGASALWAKHLAKKAAKEVAEEVVEIVARDGTKITGLTKHGVNRVIGDGAKRAGTKPEAILDALKNPTKIKEGVDNLGRPYKVYQGANARVVVNPQTGKIVSTNPLSKAGAN